MSLLALAAMATVPVYLVVILVTWALVRPRTRPDWTTFLFIFLAMTAWLLVVLLLASGIDDASSGVLPLIRELEDALGGGGR